MVKKNTIFTQALFEYGMFIYLVPPFQRPFKGGDGLSSPPSLSEELLKDRKKDFAE
jgi:hypothetical protein